MVIPNFREKGTLLTFGGVGGAKFLFKKKKIHDNKHGHGDTLRSEQI